MEFVVSDTFAEKFINYFRQVKIGWFSCNKSYKEYSLPVNEGIFKIKYKDELWRASIVLKKYDNDYLFHLWRYNRKKYNKLYSDTLTKVIKRYEKRLSKC